ncbi:MAG: hypothetical protein D8M59_05335 [Planctomycetes bacterium]|nr:hypothetical protein [Planctomycetota bacterium]NOG55998.1 hypothetical protein [Planctomycetota bacterium]
MRTFPCALLNTEVELSDERERHIAQRHPELLPEHLDAIAETLADPDEVRRSGRFGHASLFSKWFTHVHSGKYVVVVVVSEYEPASRHWIVTAYVSRKLASGEVIWKRD